jgi:hypothetical protein
MRNIRISRSSKRFSGNRTLGGIAVACAFLLLHGTSNAGTRGDSQQVPKPVSQCGKLDVSGSLYVLTSDITAAGGGDCLVISGHNIVLDLHGFSITGPGGSSSGTGIHIEDVSVDTSIEGYNAFVNSFEYGVDDQGLRTRGDDLNFGDGTRSGSNVVGLYMHGDNSSDWANLSFEDDGIGAMVHCNSCFLEGFYAAKNTGDAVVVTGSATASIDNFDAESNGGTGIHIGCPSGGGCINSGVNVYNGYSDSNVGDGIFLDATEAASKDRVFNDGASDNAGVDLHDATNSCGANFWFDNAAGTSKAESVSSPACIALNP